MKSDEPGPLPVPEFHRTPVLILEDNRETAHVLEAYLRHSEFQPILASSVAEAEVWTARHTPAAAVADVYIGDDLAWGFVCRIRERFPHLPLIVTSAFDEAPTAISKGANLFLPKPIERDTLLQELRRLTSQTGTRKLLLVDDNEVSRYILRDLLDQPWLDIQETATGREALSAIRERLPDAVILDLLMPDLSGFEVLRQLRSDPATERLPVLIYTSKTLSDGEKTQLDAWNAAIVRKEDITTRLSAQPFLDWVRSAGLSPEVASRNRES